MSDGSEGAIRARVALAAIAGYALLAWATTRNWGLATGAGFAALAAALVLWTAGLFAIRLAPAAVIRQAAVWTAWSAALASILAGFFLPQGFYIRAGASPVLLYLVLGVSVLLLGFLLPEVGGWRPSGRLRLARVLALLFSGLLAGAWMLRSSPVPDVDAWVVQQQGAAALLAGESPYGSMHALDTYQVRRGTGRVIVSYPYPPLNLLMTSAAFALFGDVRWALLAALLIGALLLARVAWSRRDRAGPWPEILVALLLFHPRGLFVLEQGWGEPLALPFLAAFVLLVRRGNGLAAAVALGLLCAVKQHLVLFLPFAALLPAVRWRGALLAAAVTAATILPFAIWTPVELWQDLVVHHLENPFRPDSLSFGTLAVRLGARGWPSWIGFLAAAAGLALTAWRARDLPRVVLGSALGFGLFFAFGRQAFCNYYYLVGATALLAAAAAVALEGSPHGVGVSDARAGDDRLPLPG